MATTPDFSALRAQAMGSNLEEEAVTVNTRALIDKVLARYSGEWTVLRELLQNAADASASKVTIRFETLPSSSVPVPQSSDPSTVLKHTLLHHSLKRLIVSNDGKAFGSNDWSRLKRIAEGNPDETKIGAFGVGFYSVFADCEEPFVRSGNEAMAFYWKGNSLFTRRLQLSEAQSSPDTNFVLDYRNSTSPIPKLLPLCHFLASSITFVGLAQVELWLDDCRLLSLTKLIAPGVEVKIPKTLETKTHEGLFRIESVIRETVQLEAKWLNIVAWKPKASPIISTGGSTSSTGKGATSTQSLKSFFSRFAQNTNTTVAERAAQEDKETQVAISEDFMGECKATVFLHVSTATIRAKINTTFSQELERATKKPPPKSTKIAVLTTSYDEKSASTSSIIGAASKTTDIFASVLPTKSGRIFIGFPTHQTTGLSAHISAQSVIPTVERESIDLNARWVRTWNMEMLRAAGIVCRIAWSGEIVHLKERLSRSLADSQMTKLKQEHIERVLPEATHMLNQFTFRESTPSSQVGTLVEEAFWTCNHNTTIEILSSCGVMPSQDVRIATEELSFVEGIPVLPPELMKDASGFVQKLVDFGIITDITTGDIKKELERQALNEKQLIEFLHWLGHKARINEVDPMIVRSLLDVAVVNEGDGDNKLGNVVMLGEIKHFINPSRIPGTVPVPPDTLSFKFTKNIDKVQLEALGWEDLQIVPWLRWLVDMSGGRGSLPKDQDLTTSASFASVVLPILSKQWDGLSQSSKATVLNLLNTRTVIPTKLGMKKPSEAYFPIVKLFDDLPVIVGLQSVKDKFLIAVGVRRTVELGLIFEKLMAPPDYSADASLVKPAWSHVDLIKYLASVRNDIPNDDVKRLRDTAICPAEAANGKATDKRYRLIELFEPSDVLRAMGLPLLQWPGIFRSGSEEGKFLTFLGLKKFPDVAELIPLISSAAANGDIGLRDRALKYFVNYHFQHGCSVQETANTKIRYLPLEGEDPKVSVLPTECYINESATVMGFRVLRRDLHPHAVRLGVESHPPILQCVERLVKVPPENHRRAIEVFSYFASRLNEINGRSLEILTQGSFVPATPKPPSSKESNRFLPPRLCFLGAGNDNKYSGIFDYVDFGSTANSFLLRCGSKHEPNTQELAQLVVREPARVFTVLDSPDRYLELLRTLAASWPNLKKDKALVKEMKKVPFLLGYKEFSAQSPSGYRQSRLNNTPDAYVDEDDVGVKTYELASADQIVIVDDVVNYGLFKGNFLAAPMEEDLENLYLGLGSTLLGNLVEQKLQIGQPMEDWSEAAKLETLIRERIKLFMHDIPTDIVRHNAAWVERNLSIIMVRSLSLRKSLRARNVTHTESKTAVQAKDQQLGHRQFLGYTLFVTPGTRDLYDVSQALSHLLLTRPKPQHVITLTVLLETDLYKLRSRGYNVERILQKKAAEKRVLEDQRKQQLEEEQRSISEQEAARSNHQVQLSNGDSSHPMMPGVFPDSPDRRPQSSQSRETESDMPREKRRGGFFSAITRALGTDDGRPPPLVGDGGGLPPPPYSSADPERAMTTTMAPQPATAPQELQQNLVNAIKSARAHNSQTVTSRPEINSVSETQTFCDAKPAQDISFYALTSSGAKVYLSNAMVNKDRFIAQNSTALDAFASVLIDCADTFALSRSSIHLFQDDGSSTIAFNLNQALFFNYRYFENLHLPNVLHGNKADAMVYWFVVLCHELAHNLVADHSSAHSYYTESFLIQYFTRIVAKIASVSRSLGDTNLLD
ncbi:hypothetical protein MMC26_004888 [Xylographa opegraphella]|nr:hypothetical protein [Xylographa opegraphella]